MVKSKILTPVLAGVLGVAVLGSGVGYYFTKDDANDAKNGSKLSQVADNLSNTLDTAEKAISGELDFAYSANATVSFGEGFTSVSGMQLQSIEVNTNTKQKGGNTGADFSLKYGGNNLVSMNTVIDRENKNMYIKIPELSDAYMKANGDSVKELINSELSDSGADVAVDQIFGDSAVPTYDSEALEQDLQSYCDLFKEKCPDPVEGDSISGEIEGYKYEYTTKVYTITGEDAKNIIKSMLEKAKTDETLKNAVIQENAEITAETYDEMISEYLSEIDTAFDESDLTDSVTFDAYYDEDTLVGFNLNKEDVSAKLISYSTSEADAVDFSFVSGTDCNMTLKGSSKTEDDTVNGSYTFDMSATDSTINATCKLENVKTVGDAVSGKIRTDISVSGTDADAFTCWCEFNSNSTEEKSDFTYEVGMDGQSYITVSFTGNKTEASDITIPSGDNIYDVTDENALNTYLTGCNTDAFMENIKTALGDELYTMIFESSTGNYDDDYYYDDYYDYYDYDYDLDSQEWSLGNDNEAV